MKIGKKSQCDRLIEDLEKFLPDYSKGESGIYQKVMHKTDLAITNSKMALLQGQETGTDNPTTNMHELVEYLQQLKS